MAASERASKPSRDDAFGPDQPLKPARILTHLTAEACDKIASTSLRLLAVLRVLFQYAAVFMDGEPSGAHLVRTAFSRTSPRQVVRNAG